MKKPKTTLKENEDLLFTITYATPGFLHTEENGRLFLTNQRIFVENYFGTGIEYSINLKTIRECRLGRFWILFTFPFPLRCIDLFDDDGFLIKKIQCGGFLGSHRIELRRLINLQIEKLRKFKQ